MVLDAIRTFVSRRPGWIVTIWLVVAVVVGCFSPDLTKLAAEGQAKMLAVGRGESARGGAGQAVVARPGLRVDGRGGPAPAERADRGRPAVCAAAVAAVRGGRAAAARSSGCSGRRRVPEIAAAPGQPRRHGRAGGRVALVVVRRAGHAGRGRLDGAPGDRPPSWPLPAGLELRWTGDAVIGRDYMANVQTSLDRAAVATVVLLLIVLLVVYRSFWLALVPLATIGVSLVISRGLLAWMILAGWEVSSLVELFLIAILFGTGTDFCLFLSWRFAEHFNPNNPAGSMRVTLARSFAALVTSAGTIIIGLLLMGTTRFKLFSSTGPSVAMGLVLALAATLSLTPALLVLLARVHPRAFDGLAGSSTGVLGPAGPRGDGAAVAELGLHDPGDAPAVDSGLRTHFIQDLMTELPASARSARGFPAGRLEVRARACWPR